MLAEQLNIILKMCLQKNRAKTDPNRRVPWCTQNATQGVGVQWTWRIYEKRRLLMRINKQEMHPRAAEYSKGWQGHVEICFVGGKVKKTCREGLKVGKTSDLLRWKGWWLELKTTQDSSQIPKAVFIESLCEAFAVDRHDRLSLPRGLAASSEPHESELTIYCCGALHSIQLKDWASHLPFLFLFMCLNDKGAAHTQRDFFYMTIIPANNFQ